MATADEDDLEYAIESIDAEEPVWNATILNIFLDECLQRKKDLHKKNCAGSKFFGMIRRKMLERGFNFRADTLAEKFISLQRQFSKLKPKHDSTPKRSITWPYYDKMNNLLSPKADVNAVEGEASLKPNVVGEAEEQLEGAQTGNESIDETEAQWCHEAVVAFLQECCKRKQDLWNPHVRRRKIFIEIRRVLRLKGYHFFYETLDRKLRNMKKHYNVVSEASSKGKIKHITWPYYKFLNEIYGDKAAREAHRQQLQELCGAKRPCLSDVGHDLDISIDSGSEPEASYSPFVPETYIDPEPELGTSSSNPDSRVRSKARNPIQAGCGERDSPRQSTTESSQEDFWKRILALEKRKAVAAEQLVEEIRNANRLSRERLEFQRTKLAYLWKKQAPENDRCS